jgi:hypothetical protein
MTSFSDTPLLIFSYQYVSSDYRLSKTVFSSECISNTVTVILLSLMKLFIQTSSGAHPASYPVGTGVSLPGGKVARVSS